jgi:hypothetical protein
VLMIPDKFDSLEQLREWAIKNLNVSEKTIDRMIGSDLCIRFDLTPSGARVVGADDADV